MPLVDMPLDQLKQYTGSNPRPDDFDEYWERALTAMQETDPQVELVRSEFQVPYAECFHLYFNGTGGARIHAKLVRSLHARKPHPAVLQFHGYAHHSADWADKLIYASVGFTVVAMDCRGQGGNSEDTGGIKGTTHKGHIIRGLDDHPDRLLFRQIFLDTAQLAGIVMNMPEVDAERVAAIGGSQGGGLALACAALEPRVNRAAPSVPFLCDYRRVWEMDLARDAYEELRTFFRHHDPQHLRETEIFEKLGYIDVRHLAPRIRGKVMMGVGLLDTVCPPSTQFAAYNAIGSEKRMEIYPDFVHERLPAFEDKTIQFLLEM
ncbi:acetylesterase [Paenibacillus sp. MY03]|uniref:alpha/beta fold hydrolase n=1 Tax=Paenibacillus sp. MY03 TaxID=302980 RepID=UPI000B3C598E|nr:alpha/beta fold hydrolase [Paenibacillus sp. MY03]OUS76516.1 acetylesterase [Paenibacillus sp. MY03]